MELFEQAHVAKSMETTKKDSKSQETVKKQLKQMLYGYKKSDNEMIKNSIDLNTHSNDSSSVSGFSDLNLTVSSGADDTTKATIGSPDDVDSILDDLNIDISPKITDLSLESDIEEKSTSQDSINVEVSSMSENLLLDSDDNSSFKNVMEDGELSFIGSSVKSLTDTESSQEFDPDGFLASKIHEKLRNKKQPQKLKKRKLEKEKYKEDEMIIKNKSGAKSKKIKPPNLPPLHSHLLGDDPFDVQSNKSASKSSTAKSTALSPPYISMKATEMHQENFFDVLGKYKYPVIKNIPYENNELIFSATTSSFYSGNLLTIDENDMAEEITNLSEAGLHSMNDEVSQDDNIESVANIESNKDSKIEESTENIDDTVLSEELLTKNILDDSIKLLFKRNLCVCVMRHPATLYANGKFKVRSLAGTVEVFGHILTENFIEIYAPYSNFSQSLSTIENDNTFFGLFSKLTMLGLSVADAENIVTTIGENDAVLIFEPLKSVKIDFIEQHFTVANLFTKSNKHVGNCHAKALERLESSIYMSKPRKVFEIPISWQEISKYCFKTQSRGIFCGGKGVGKSTCLRYHVNRLLTHGPVLVIDLDIGQSEFTVAGNISASVVEEPLLGPNFTHLRKPERTLNLGMINALDNMRRYMNAVVRLISYCVSDERLRSMRWLVNTMGLCNVVGLDFITIIILHCEPTYLVQIDSKNVKKRFDMFLRPQLVSAHYEYNKNKSIFANITPPDNLNYGFVLSHHTESPVRNNNLLAPRDERYLNFLAYFSEVFQLDRVPTLLGIAPYEVQLQDLCVYMNVKIPEGTVQQVLNGKIVALCQHKPGSVTKKTFVLADEPLLCHGHGLIRGIHFERGILYVITPMSIDSLQEVNTILYADWVPELRGQEAHLPADTLVPYRMPTMYQQKQLMLTPRRRFNPLQLLKMSRGS